MRKLLDVMRDMLALEQARDTEEIHARADELLVETIRILLEKPNITQQRQRILCTQIIAAYENLEKWYN